MLTGVLAGGGFGSGVQGLYADTAVPNNCAHFFLAVDPAAFGAADEFASNAALLAEQIEASPTKPGTDRVYLPGQIEHGRGEAAARTGIRVGRSGPLLHRCVRRRREVYPSGGARSPPSKCRRGAAMITDSRPR